MESKPVLGKYNRINKALLVLGIFLGFSTSLYSNCTLGAQTTNGFGSSGSPCEITTAAQLQAINTSATTLGYYYKLMNDIDLTGVSWVNIGTASGDGFRFDGNFDGDNFTISNLTSFTYTTANKGLFGTIEGANSSSKAVVKNLKLDGFNVTNNSANQGVAGSLAGYAKYATISNIQVTNTTIERTATDSSWVGGLIGHVDYSTISDVNVSASVTAGQTVGGLVGRAYQVTITNSKSSGSVTVTSNCAGGLIGNSLSSSAIQYCSSNSTVSGVGSGGLGGLIGYAQDTSQIDQSYATGSVGITDNNGPVGGLIGMIQCGTVYGVKVTDCYATGAVTTTGTNTSGFPGLGGLVGYSYQGYMYKCYSTGAVDKTGTYGGAIASVTSSYANNVFYDIQTALANDSTGSASITGVTSKTTAELKTLTTFPSGTWSIDGADGNYPNLTFAGDTIWTMADYIVSYDGNGNTAGTPPSRQGKQNGVDLTITSSSGTLTKTGYAIDRWDTSADGSGTPYSAGDAFTTNADTTLYAHWAVAYVISYNGNSKTGGSVPANQNKFNGTNLTLASNTGSLVRTGYTFSGWNTAADGSGTDYAEGATYSTEADDVLYAKWIADTYTISFDGNGNSGGAAPANQTKTHDTNLTLASNTGSLVKTGYTFSGWNTAADGSGTDYAEGATYSTEGTNTLYAKWIADTYTISFDGNGNSGGAVPANQTKTHDTNLTLASNTGSLVRTGYTFSGWNTAADGSGTDYAEGATYSTEAADTLYAKWTINSFTVSFNVNGGSAVASQTIDYGSTATSPTAPTKTNYTFGGWYSDAGLTSSFNFATAITSATTLYAKWTATSSVITGYTNSGTTHTVALNSGNVTLNLQDNSTVTYTDVTTDISSTLDKSSDDSFVKSITTKIKTNGSIWNELIYRKTALSTETTEYTSTLESEISNCTLTRDSNGTISLDIALSQTKQAHITSDDEGTITSYTNLSNDTETKDAQLISEIKGTSCKVDSNSTIEMTSTTFNLKENGYINDDGTWEGSIIQKVDSNNTVTSTYTIENSLNPSEQKSVSVVVASDLQGVSEVSDVVQLVNTEDVLLTQKSQEVGGVIGVIIVRTSGKVKTYFHNKTTDQKRETSVIDYPFESTDYQQVNVTVEKDSSGKLKFDITAPLVESIEF